MKAGASRQDPPALNVGVASSGGRDSTALLHCVARLAMRLNVRVHALHVNHGLQPQADQWQRRLATQCRRWARAGLPLDFQVRRLTGQPAAGDSVEAWARRARYAALADMAAACQCSIVLLAHHRGDQAETVLLQALRGAGPAGLSAMPERSDRGGLTWARPWLERSRDDIEAYVRRHRLSYIDDPSNASPRFSRNRLRHQVWPSLLAGFPDAETTLAAVARRAQEAASLARELASVDSATMVLQGRLQLGPWLKLSEARRRNLMRHWLSEQVPGSVPESLLDRLELELPHKSTGRWPAGPGELRLHGGTVCSWAHRAASEVGTETSPAMDLSAAGSYQLAGWRGRLLVTEVQSGGVDAGLLATASVRSRGGAEQFQSAPKSTARSLKKQFQAHGVPAWDRDGPLVWLGDRLAYVAGLGFDARCIAPPGVPQRGLQWVSAEGEASGSPG